MAETTAAASLKTRLGGQDRYETAVQVSQAGWKTSDYVILASGQEFADALCAALLAKKLNAPILLTQGNELNSAAKTEIQRLNAKHVVIIGLTGAVSGTVEQEVKALGADTERIGGADRYETSTLVAKQLDTSSSVVLASGETFPDALSIAPIAASKEMPILLTRPGQLPQTVADYISQNKSHITKTYVVG